MAHLFMNLCQSYNHEHPPTFSPGGPGTPQSPYEKESKMRIKPIFDQSIKWI